MRRHLLAIALLSLACAGSPDAPTAYLLRSELSSHPVSTEVPMRVGLGRVVVAPYLSQPGIVVETEAGQVHAARAHVWAEPLGAGVRSLLRAELSRAIGEEVNVDQATRTQWAYAVDVSIDRLHGTMHGSAVIDAAFRITTHADPGSAIESRFSRSTLIPREGYDGMIEAEASLVAALADAIAARLREIEPLAGSSP
jgi:uncharacterized lipoprotein YmbA